MSIYARLGHATRRDYLNSLAQYYQVEASTVYSLASDLGEDEDFDELISALELEAD